MARECRRAYLQRRLVLRERELAHLHQHQTVLAVAAATTAVEEDLRQEHLRSSAVRCVRACAGVRCAGV